MHPTRSHPRWEQPDGARGDEGGDTRGAAEQVRDADEPAEHPDRQPGVVGPSDDPEVPVAYDRHEHESDRAGTDDDPEKQRQIQGHLGFVDCDQNASPGRSQRDEGK